MESLTQLTKVAFTYKNATPVGLIQEYLLSHDLSDLLVEMKMRRCLVVHIISQLSDAKGVKCR